MRRRRRIFHAMNKKLYCFAFILLSSVSLSAQEGGGVRQDAAGSVPSSAAAAVKAKKIGKTTAGEIKDRLREWDQKLNSVKCEFTQTMYFKEAGLKQVSAGELFYLKPGLLRIDTESPAQQRITTDKKTIWIYKPADGQAVTAQWKDWASSQGAAFAGLLDFGNYSSITETNTVELVSADESGYVLKLKPKDSSGYTLTLVLDKDFFPSETVLDTEESSASVRLKNVKKNIDIKRDIFVFDPPKGTEIIKF